MLVTGSALLAVARENHFALPAFNVSDFSMMKGLFEVSEAEQAPLLIAIHPDELAHVGIDLVAAALHAARRSSVPVAVHLDHGGTYEQILGAIQTGFTSVMIDGSTLEYEDNVAITRRVVDAAHAVGLSVEGELGTIGKTDDEGEAGADFIVYTDPAQAADFVAATGVDSLAVAIGTCHGLYPDWKLPELKLDLLAEIEASVDVPLVLHGGSNNPDTEMAAATKLGVGKINISSDIKTAYYDTMREVLQNKGLREPNRIEPACVAAMKTVAAHKINLFGAAGTAHLY
jgi:fructose-bisphosphate aldolase class II